MLSAEIQARGGWKMLKDRSAEWATGGAAGAANVGPASKRTCNGAALAINALAPQPGQ